MSDELDIVELKKSLDVLRKSSAAGGTNTTAVETMSAQGGATQVFHTSSNSDPASWAGSAGKDVTANGATDGISSNGTDYDGRGVMKSIMAKVAKGLALSGVEKAILKAFSEDDKAMDKAFGAVADADDDKDDKDKENPFKAKKAMDKEDDKDEVAKSLSDLAKGNPTLEAGFEMTDFLKEMVDTISKSQSNLEARIARHVDARIGSLVTMNKSLGDALAGVGDATVYTANKISQFENGPARGVKSVVQAAEPVSKGGFGGGQTGLEGLSKSQIADCLANLMMSKSYNVTAQDVLKFESTGNLTPALRDAVVASRRA